MLSRYVRNQMLEVEGQDYVRTARAKGLKESAVVLVHVLRNSMIPIITVIALGVPSIFGGAIITETLFKVNGIGQLLLTALFANDLPADGDDHVAAHLEALPNEEHGLIDAAQVRRRPPPGSGPRPGKRQRGQPRDVAKSAGPPR